MLWVSGSQTEDRMYIRFQKGRIIHGTEWFTDNASIDLCGDDSPAGVTVYQYYTHPSWPFNDDILTKYGLGPWADDLITVKDSYFNPNARLSLQRR